MFFRLIEYIRAKPLAARRLIALGCAAVVTGSIAVAWGLTLPAKISSIHVQTTDSSQQVSTVKESIQEGAQSVQDLIQTGKELQAAISAAQHQASSSSEQVEEDILSDTSPNPTPDKDNQHVAEPRAILIATTSSSVASPQASSSE